MCLLALANRQLNVHSHGSWNGLETPYAMALSGLPFPQVDDVYKHPPTQFLHTAPAKKHSIPTYGEKLGEVRVRSLEIWLDIVMELGASS